MSFAFSKKALVWLGFLFWICFASTAIALTFGFTGEIANYKYGAAGWPRVLFTGIIVVAIIQLLVSLRNFTQCPSESPERITDRSSTPVSIAGLPLKTLAAPVIYVAFLPQVGFFAATPIFLASVMLIMGERRLPIIAAVTAGIYAFVLLVFVKLLFVPLPIGSWPGFYEFGNWLLVTIR